VRAIVIDRSLSLEGQEAEVERLARSACGDLDPTKDRVVTLAFGAGPVRGLGPVPVAELDTALTAALSAPLDSRGSDLGGALSLGLEMLRPTSKASDMVLITDGRDTHGGARRAAIALAQLGLPVYPAPVSGHPQSSLKMTRVRAPAHVAQGEVARVDVELESRDDLRFEVILETQPGNPFVTILPGKVGDFLRREVPLTISFQVKSSIEQFVVLWARARALGGRETLQDSAPISLRVGKGIPWIYSSGEHQKSALAEVLESWHGPPQRLAPERLSQVLGVNLLPTLVVLEEVAWESLGEPGALALKQQLDRGGSLIVAGGRRAFGGGGYSKTALEELLPVLSGAPDDPSRPLVFGLVLDGSSSMQRLTTSKTGETKSRYQAALEACLPLDQLQKGDHVEVLVFQDHAAPTPVMSLAPLADVAALMRILAARVPEGGTRTAPALCREISADHFFGYIGSDA
jgi:hypothetical protein